jgi:serine/threonine-protein kinase
MISLAMAALERIGRYRVLGLVGRGAMGVVYRGRDESLDRDVALKLIRGASDAEARARFLREARAAARLQHPNIVTIYEAGEHEGAPFMAMELLQGVDLQRAIESGLRPDPKVTLPIVLQLLAGLGHAHEHGIVHRDVKPSNLFLPRGRPAKIMDFGVARLGEGSAATGIVGTPNYMSPEQVSGGSLDGRSDLFSAGLILYELVTGEKAYQGDSVVALVYKIAHEDPDLSLLPRVEAWAQLRKVLAGALARDPEMRYPDAGHMQDELALALRDLGGQSDWTTASDRGLAFRSKAPAPEPEPPAGGSGGTGESPQLDERGRMAARLHYVEPRQRDLAALGPHSARANDPVPRSLRAGLSAAALVAVGLLAAGGVMLARSSHSPVPAVPATTLAASLPPTPQLAPATVPAARPATPAPATTLAPVSSAPAPASPTPRGTPTPEAREAPVPADGRVDRANDLLEQGRFAAALAEARSVLRRDPGNAEAKMIAAEAEAATVVETRVRNAREALKRGDRDAALAEVRAGLAVSSNDARLLALFRELTR